MATLFNLRHWGIEISRFNRLVSWVSAFFFGVLVETALLPISFAAISWAETPFFATLITKPFKKLGAECLVVNGRISLGVPCADSLGSIVRIFYFNSFANACLE